MTHDMTRQTKPPLSHDGGDPWEGAIKFFVGHVIGFSATFFCRCHPVHSLQFALATMNRIHIEGSVRPSS